MADTNSPASVNQDRLPHIVLTAADLARLDLLTGRSPRYRSPEMHMLARELARAEVVSPMDVPPHAVTMGSTVRYRDGDTGEMLTATVVYPGQDDPAERKISVLSPEGCALIGLSEGQSIRYVTRGGRAKWLIVLRVVFQPEARGLARK